MQNPKDGQLDLDRMISEISKDLKVNYTVCHAIIKSYIVRSESASAIVVEELEEINKSDKIRRMYDEGMTVGAISKELHSNYSYVWAVVARHRPKK